MGVPKFFRWMSERYPAISQLIAENRIPEFDALYLDMNGIIHNCTHKDSDSPSFRMTEDKMFIAIFNYIEHLFGKIKPKQLFFMAIDGVAPRAKMNQQRSRRFRTALDSEKAREKAIREGVELPKEPPFDSNCITPGTEFMAKLTKQLKYFIAKKVSEDRDWQGVEVVLSGHEVPGEGEHKIMEYIRLAKQQGNYDPNMRHCLYGLDADLIMLGLLSHDPHFCLLREEVTFGRQTSKKSKELEHQNFYLMHLCIVREYLELEFKELKDPSVLPFKFDMERVIDDFILMAFFVGNDFLPNLPNLHINEGALSLMFKIYKEVLPKAGGYINERGVINMERLGVLLDSLQDIEYRFFEADVQDTSWFKGKQMERVDVMEKNKVRKGHAQALTVSTSQKLLFEDVKSFVNHKPSGGQSVPLNLSSTLPARDRKFVTDLADALHLQWKTVDDGDGERHLQLLFPPKLEDDDESDDEEASLALQRVLKRYSNAKIVDETVEDVKAKAQQKYDDKFKNWKTKYYEEKFDWGLENEEELRKLTENYVQGLQWVLFYYYRGVASWPWFYAYHYSPMISDVRKGLGADVKFNLGQPFKPYEQLMGVLPDRSKQIVPQAYWPLMTDPQSPIVDFYPRDFELDMNGKKQEWEAIVKIPFIDEKRLLPAMRTREHLLAPDEAARNDFGVSLKFTYSDDLDFTYMSSLPGIFPDIPNCHCVENIFDLPTAHGLDSPFALVEGVKLGAAALAGFPSLHTLPNTGDLDFASVSVFQQESRNESMVITIMNPEERSKIEYAKSQLGNRVFVGYPFLDEAKIVRVSDELFDYVLSDDASGVPVAIPHGPFEIDQWKRRAVRVENHYAKRLGMITGQIEALVHVEMLKGLKKTDEGATVKDYGVISGIETDYAIQMTVGEVISEDQRFIEKAALPIEEEFPVGSRAFCLGTFGYGRPLEVTGHHSDRAHIYMMMPNFQEPFYIKNIVKQAEGASSYVPSFAVARTLGINPLVLSKLTSSFSVNLGGVRLNLGLNLKFEAKKLKVLGYSRRSDSGWEFSGKAIELISQYMIRFPDFIAAVQAKPKGDIYNAEEMFGDAAMIRIKEIQAWLKDVESKSFEKVPLDADQLDSDIIATIQSVIDSTPEIATPPEQQHSLYYRKKVNSVPRHALLKPEDSEHRLGNQKFSVGDRVIYVQDSGRVPIAAKGTVVGLTRTPRATLLDILFDRTFMSGTTLNDRCQPFRGSTVPSSSVLNLSYKQLEVGSQNQAKKQNGNASSTNGMVYGAPQMPGGRGGQLVPAATPAPLRGSFRGAVSGQAVPRNQPIAVTGFQPTAQTNGHTNGNARGGQRGGTRGRGAPSGPRRGQAGVNAQGYGPIDNGDPDPSVLARNPNFRPKSYNQVAPPTELDVAAGNQRGRGGRGRGRGRGGRGRGQAQSQTQGQSSV